MSRFGEDLIKSMKEALAHSRGEGVPDMRVTRFCNPREVRARVGLTQTEMAPLMGMSLSGYRKWEQGERAVSGPAVNLLRIIEKHPEAAIDALRS